MLLAPSGVDCPVVGGELGLTLLFLRFGLLVADPDERHEAVEVPLLALYRDAIAEHVEIQELRRHDPLLPAVILRLGEPGCRVRVVYIRLYASDALVGEAFVHERVDASVDRHAPDIVERLLRSEALGGEERLVPLRLPF